MLSILAIGVGLTWCFGKAVGDTRQGWAILTAMGVLFLAGAAIAYWQEAAGNPLPHPPAVSGRNMEGQAVPFGIAPSEPLSVATTAPSGGAVTTIPTSLHPAPTRTR